MFTGMKQKKVFEEAQEKPSKLSPDFLRKNLLVFG